MRLLLLRHAEANPGHPDEERALSSRGRRDAEAMGRWLRASNVALPSVIHHSPYRRARETAQLLAAALPPGHTLAVQTQPPATPEDALQPWLRKLGTADEDLFLVSHNPFVTKLAASLLRLAAADAPFVVVPCTLIVLSRRTAPTPGGPGVWDLEALVPPELLPEG